MVFKFNILPSKTFGILGILCGLALLPALGLILSVGYIWGTVIAILWISPFTLNNTCETNFDKGLYIFRIHYLFFSIITKTYKISAFQVYSYKRKTVGRRSNTHSNTTLNVHNPKTQLTETIAFGDEFAVKELIEQLKNRGYIWKKSVS